MNHQAADLGLGGRLVSARCQLNDAGAENVFGGPVYDVKQPVLPRRIAKNMRRTIEKCPLVQRLDESERKPIFGLPRQSDLDSVLPGALPPCFIIGAGEDTWCLADSLALAQALSAATNPYELHVMEGMPHGFMQMSALDGWRAAMRLLGEFLARNV